MRVHFALALLLAASGCGRQAPGADPALDGAAVLDLGASDQLEPRPWCNGCRSPAVCVCTLAGSGSLSGDEDGPLSRARFSQPRGVAVDHLGAIYIADTGNHRVRVISRGEVRTLAGSATAGFADGAAATAQFSRGSTSSAANECPPSPGASTGTAMVQRRPRGSAISRGWR